MNSYQNSISEIWSKYKKGLMALIRIVLPVKIMTI